MGKINKYSNLYDKNGKIIRKVNNNGILKNVTIPELEELIDKYDGDKNDRELDNMKMALFQMYNKYGDPHRDELVKRLLEEQAKKTNPKDVTNKLQELNDYIEENKIVNLELKKPWMEDGTDEMVAELNEAAEQEKTDEFEYIEDVENIEPGDGILAQAKRDYVINYDPEQHEAELQKYVNNIQAA